MRPARVEPGVSSLCRWKMISYWSKMSWSDVDKVLTVTSKPCSGGVLTLDTVWEKRSTAARRGNSRAVLHLEAAFPDWVNIQIRSYGSGRGPVAPADFKSVVPRDERGRWVRLPRTPARLHITSPELTPIQLRIGVFFVLCRLPTSDTIWLYWQTGWHTGLPKRTRRRQGESRCPRC